MKKKILSLFLTICMVLSLLPVVSLSAAAEYTPSGTMTDLYDAVVTNGGTAPTSGYYSISSATELGYLSEYTKAGKNTSGVTFYLTQNIVLNAGITFTFDADTGLVAVTNGTKTFWLGTGTTGDDSGSNTTFDSSASTAGKVYADQNGTTGAAPFTLSEWTPIGDRGSTYDTSRYFHGTFDGCNYTVSGVYINGTNNYRGFFSFVVNGTIQNVGLINSYIKGKSATGGIAAWVEDSSITNCDNTASVKGDNSTAGIAGHVEGSSITNCDNTGCIKGNGYVGGIAGYCYDGNTISNCSNTGSVIGNYECVGGVAGYLYNSTAQYCYNTGRVKGTNDNNGGVVGCNWKGTISCCYNTGSVTGSSYYTGGVTGKNDEGTVKNCYNTGSVTGGSYYTGGVVGYNYSSSTVNYCYNAGYVKNSGSYVYSVVGRNGGTIGYCYYDKQMSTIGGGATGATGLLTSNLATGSAFSGWSSTVWTFTSGLYPRLSGYVDAGTDYKMDETDAAYLGAAPVTLDSADKYTSVSTNFEVSTATNDSTGHSVSWACDDSCLNIGTDGSVTILEGGSSVSLTATCSDDTKTVLLTKVVAPIEAIDDQYLSSLTAGYNDGAQETRTVTITRSGGNDLANLSVSLSGADAGSFTITQPEDTTLNDSITETTFTVNANDGLSEGTYTATVTVSANDIDYVTFTVTQLVGEAYSIMAIDNQTLTTLTYDYSSGTQEAREITIRKSCSEDLTNLSVSLSGGDTSDFNITQPATGTLDDSTQFTTFTVAANDTLSPGTYTETVTIGADNMTDVTFTVTQVISDSYLMETINDQTLTGLAQGYASGTQETRDIIITSIGTGDLENLSVSLSSGSSFTVTQPTVTTLDDTTPSTTFSITADDDLESGTYVATVTISADNMEDVTFMVKQIVLIYSMTPIDDQTFTPVTFGYSSGTQETKTLTITRTGTGDLANLSASLSGGGTSNFTLTQPAATTLTSSKTSTTFTVKAKNDLSPGTYTETVTISADNMSDVTFTVTQVVNDTYTIEAIDKQILTDIPEGYSSGTQETREITITKSGTGDLTNLSVMLSSGSSFTITQPTAATLDDATPSTTFTVTAKDGLAKGTYTDTVTISADHMADVTFTVEQNVVDYSLASIEDQTLFALVDGYSSGTQEAHQIEIESTGTGDLTNLSVTLSSGDTSAFQITQPSDTTLTYTEPYAYFAVEAADGLAAGTYTATVTVSADNVSSETFVVSLTIYASMSGIAEFSYTAGDTFAFGEVYKISTPEALSALATAVNNGNSMAGVKFYLTGDIDLNEGVAFAFESDTGLVKVTNGTDSFWLGTGVYGDSSGSNAVFDYSASTAGEIYTDQSGTTGSAPFTPNGWTPIGGVSSGTSYSFAGSFDGDGFTVSGIYIDLEDESYQGLFGYADEGVVQNLGVLDSYLFGDDYVGGIVGAAENSSTVQYCYNTVCVIGDEYVGGVVGSNLEYSTVQCCYNIGSIAGNNYTGGIIGSNEDESKIKNCYNVGSVIGYGYNAGGVTGCNQYNSIVKNCYNAGSVWGYDYVGGVVGDNWGGTVSDCCYDKQMCTVGGIDYYDNAGSAVGIFTSDITTETPFSAWSSSAWNFTKGLYPRLRGMDETDAAYLSASPVTLRSIDSITYDTVESVSNHFSVSKANGVDWTSGDSCLSTGEEGSVTITAAGTYVTLTATCGDFSKAIVLGKVTIPKNYSLSLNQTGAYAFTAQTQGYSSVSPLSVTVTNTGDHASGDLTVVLSGTGKDAFTLSGSSIGSIAVDGSDSFTIAPEDDLSIGTYTATITVSGDDVTSRSFSVSFTVSAAPTISPTGKTFAATVGYSTPTAQEFTFTNTDTETITGLSAQLETGTNFEISTALSSDTISPGGTATIRVRPITGLSVGTYTDTLAITGDNGISLSATVKLIVKEKSSSTSSGGASSSPTYEAQLSGDDSGSLSIAVEGGNAIVNLTARYSSQVADGSALVIAMPVIDGITSYTVGIATYDLASDNGKGSVSLNTPLGNITLPSHMLSGTDGVSGDDAQITIGMVNPSDLTENVQAAVGGRPVISLSLYVDGQQTDWSNSDTPVTVSIPYSTTTEEFKNPECIVAWYIDGAGNLNCVTNGYYNEKTGMLTFETTHFSYYAVGYHQVAFTDVPEDAWYDNAVSFCAAREITTGTGDDLFTPDATLTRGQFIVMLMRAYGIDADENITDNFDDAGDTYYTGYLAAAKRLGITNGVGNNLFTPEAEITRQDMFTLLYRALDVLNELPEKDGTASLSDFSDADEISDYAEDAMETFIEAGAISGSDGKLYPLDSSNRAQMAQVLYNLLNGN